MKDSIKRRIYTKKIPTKVLANIKYIANHGEYRTTIDRAIAQFVPSDRRNDQKYIKKLKKDIVFCHMYYGVDPKGYFRYRFEERSDAARKTYVGGRETVNALKKLETPETFELFRDKYKAYETFKKYYKRDVIKVGPHDEELFCRFCEKHSTVMIKPYNATQGRGVRKIILETEEQRKNVFEEIVQKGECVIEELIRQDPEQAKFHPDSVNTVRVITCYRDGISKVVMCTARFGTGDSIIDNHCISAGVDVETGIIVTPAREAQKCGLHLVHPDTGYQIIGRIMPQWNELLELMKELARIVPEQRVIGWDMALSVDGWVIVEGNTRPALQILAGDGVGVRSILEDITR